MEKPDPVLDEMPDPVLDEMPDPVLDEVPDAVLGSSTWYSACNRHLRQFIL